MGSIPTLEGVVSQMVQTSRLKVHILTSGPDDGTPVFFIHGNCSSSTWWEEVMLALPEGFRGIALDMRGYGDTEPLPIDATLGLDDMAKDVRSLAQALGIEKHHIVAVSLGGGVVMKYMLAYPEDTLSVTLVDTMSPYGYAGSKDVAGTPCYEDGAPAGGGSINPDFVRLIEAKDRGTEDPMASRNVLRQFIFKPPFIHPREEDLLTAFMSVRIGEDWYPGDTTPSEYWPGVAPGKRGILNAVSRKYFNASGIANIQPKPPILWIRGADDLVVSNNAMWDITVLGSMDLVPGWPGPDECPPQPMLDQIRAVLERYQANGGWYREEIIADATALRDRLPRPD